MNKEVKSQMLIDGKRVLFQLDTGASVNTLPRELVGDATMKPYHGRLRMWNNDTLKPAGTCMKLITNPKNGKQYDLHFIIFDVAECTPLLSLDTCERMNLITVNEEEFDAVRVVRKVQEDYGDVFDAKQPGKLPGKTTPHRRPSIKTVVMPSRRVPVAIRAKLGKELNRLVSLGVIAPVDEPTPWVSQTVIAEKKDGSLRICIDPRELNKALQREHYTLPVLEDSLHELGRSRFFTKADLASGYWHVELDDESSMLITFQTCHGRYRWRRLPFGNQGIVRDFSKTAAGGSG